MSTKAETPMTESQRGKPTAAPAHGSRSPKTVAVRALSTHGLLLILLALIVGFSIALPDTFPTVSNMQAILNQTSVTALLALGVMVPLAAGEYDLSVGYLVGLTSILAIGLQTRSGLSWPLTVVIVIAIGAFVGLVNGLLVTRVHINSFIATLGSGEVLYGILQWYTGGQQLVGNVPVGFSNLSENVHGVPIAAIYVLVVGVILWLILEYLPQGRYLYVLGANKRAAELTGIQSKRWVPLSFMASGTITAIAGVLLASQLGVGQSSVGPEFLLPAFAAALLGATTIRPGRVNTWGTIVAVLVLAVVVAGLQQEGAQFFVQPLFDGGILIVAVGLAGFAQRRRIRQAEAQQFAAQRLPTSPVDPEEQVSEAP